MSEVDLSSVRICPACHKPLPLSAHKNMKVHHVCRQEWSRVCAMNYRRVKYHSGAPICECCGREPIAIERGFRKLCLKCHAWNGDGWIEYEGGLTYESRRAWYHAHKAERRAAL